MSTKLTTFFLEGEIEKIAIETGFIKRKRKITGQSFLETLLYSKFDNSKLSLENIAENLTKEIGEEISKQAVDNRFTFEAVSFFKRLVEKAIHEINPQKQCYNFLKDFNEIRIKDSTSFQIPDEMHEKYPGSGGSCSNACIRIQFEYDLKTGKVLDLSLHPFNKQDITNARESIPDILAGSLIIRDLGYTSEIVIKGIKKQQAYFISRLIKSAVVFELRNGKYEKLNFEKLYYYMQKSGLSSIEKEVFITEELEPVRIIIELLPTHIVEERMRRAEKEAKKKGRKFSQEYKSKAKFNLFITNIPAEMLTMPQIHETYTLRWQIELVFKIWKSIGEIHKVKAMKIERFECYLFAKLLWMLINWLIIWEINKRLHQASDKLLSFYKAFKSLKEHMSEFKIAMKTGIVILAKFIECQINISSKFHLLNKKKNKNSLYELIKVG